MNETEKQALGNAYITRGRRCQNCKHFMTGEAEYQQILKDFPDVVPLEAFPHLRAAGLVKNEGVVDDLLKGVQEGTQGGCSVDKEARIISAKYYCKEWDGLPGMRELFPVKDDLLPEELKQLRDEGGKPV